MRVHRGTAGLPNLLAPLALNASAPIWPVEWADAIAAVNLVHGLCSRLCIAPLKAIEA